MGIAARTAGMGALGRLYSNHLHLTWSAPISRCTGSMGCRHFLHPDVWDFRHLGPPQYIHIESLVHGIAARHELVEAIQHTPFLLCKEVIRGRHVIVLVQLQASNRIIP